MSRYMSLITGTAYHRRPRPAHQPNSGGPTATSRAAPAGSSCRVGSPAASRTTRGRMANRPGRPRADFRPRGGVRVGAARLDLAAALPQPPVWRPGAVLGVEQRDEVLGAHEQAVGGEGVIARPGPPARKHAQVSGEAGLNVVR